jgi:chromosome segregation ATPase
MDKKQLLVKKLKDELCESDSHITKLDLLIKNEQKISDELRKELNVALEKKESLSEYISDIELDFSKQIKKYKTEICNLNEKMLLKSSVDNENVEKMSTIVEGYEKCKTELNLMNINVIKFQKEIEEKNSIIHELEQTNVKLCENINQLSDMKRHNNLTDNTFATEIKIAEKTEEIEKLVKENAFLLEEIDQLKKRNSYLNVEISKVNHKNFELQTCINTIKNSKPNKPTNDYCCCTCF